MPKFEFNAVISLGNVITFILMLVGIASVWGQRESDISSINSTTIRHDSSILSHSISIRSLELAQERIFAQLEAIRASTDRLEKKIQ